MKHGTLLSVSCVQMCFALLSVTDSESHGGHGEGNLYQRPGSIVQPLFMQFRGVFPSILVSSFLSWNGCVLLWMAGVWYTCNCFIQWFIRGDSNQQNQGYIHTTVGYVKSRNMNTNMCQCASHHFGICCFCPSAPARKTHTHTQLFCLQEVDCLKLASQP